MNSYFNMLSKDIRRLWGQIDFPQKLVIIVLMVAAIIAISYFVAKSTEPNWGVLYSDLSEPDAVAVVDNLNKAGYPYKISDDKKSILVPVELKEELRLMIAENDIIRDSNPGFELLDKMQLGATDFQNKLTKQRIFQGELTRTIEKIRGIRKARVQIADPERSVFSDKDETPSASVMLILDPGVKLKPDQIKAIKNLVAYGIPRLTPERVFLTDQSGSPLSEELSKNSGDLSDYRTDYENRVANKVQKVLEKLVGEENISVEVSAVINFDRTQSTIERYLPANANIDTPEGILSSARTESEVYDKDGSGPQVNNPAGNDKNSNYEKTKVLKEYNVSKEVKQTVFAPGNVERLTIAVAMNKILTTREKEEIKNLVISASGANVDRGDMISITGMQFASDPNNEEAIQVVKEISKTSNMEFWIRNVAPLVVVLILGLSALFVFASLLKKPIQGEEVYDSEGYYVERGDDEPDLLEATSIPAIEAKLDPELERMKSDLNNIIMTNPSEAARLLLSYIKE